MFQTRVANYDAIFTWLWPSLASLAPQFIGGLHFEYDLGVQFALLHPHQEGHPGEDLRQKEVAKEKGIGMGKLQRSADVAYNTVKRMFKDPYYITTTETLER